MVLGKVTFIDKEWTVNKTPEEAFNFFSDVNHWSEWCSVIRESGRNDSGDLTKGEIIFFTPSIIPFKSLAAEVFVVDPPHHICWGVEFPGGRIQHGFKFQANNGGTTFRQYEFLEGLLSPVGYPLKPILSNFDENWGNDLRKAINQR